MSDHVLHTTFVTFNRLELTKRTITSYLETVTLPFSAVVVDNDSSDGTAEWLRDERPCDFFILGWNHYPGFAANYGWEWAREDVSLYHRSDNDMEYQAGWCEEVVRCFEDSTVGQVGLRTLEEEGPHAAVGGNAVIRREAWDAGARYDERPWQQCKFEDAAMSRTIHRLGYRWERVKIPCATHIGIASSTDPYYQKTFTDRGITFAEWGIE